MPELLRLAAANRLRAGAHRLGRAARRRPAAATGFVWGLICLARLFLGGVVGLADNFDGQRLTCQLGVALPPLAPGQAMGAFLTPHYDPYTWYGEACGAGGTGQPYLSTEYFPLLLAKLLTRIYGTAGALDLRMLGLICTGAVAFAVAWTVRELPGPTWVRVLIASVLGLAAVDSAVAPYYVSPYAEPAAIIGLLLLVPALLRLFGRDRVRAREVVLVALLAGWTIAALTQAASLLLVAVPALLWRPSARWYRARTGRPGGRAGRVFGHVAARGPAILACLCLILGTAAYQARQSRWLNEATRYDQVFGTILGHSPDPAADLRALGLPADLAGAAGSTIGAADSAARLPDYPAFLRQASFEDILGFYTTHPLRLFGLADRGLRAVAADRPSYLGSYTAGGGAEPFQQECRACVSAALLTLTSPVRRLVLPGLWLGALMAGFALVRRRSAPARAKAVGGVLLVFGAGTVAQFWTVLLSAGDADIDRHMVLVDLGTMLLGPLLIAALAAADLRGSAVPGSAAPAPVPVPRAGIAATRLSARPRG